MKFPEQFRVKYPGTPYQSKPGDAYGSFLLPSHKTPGRRALGIIACDGLDTGWEHVSVSVIVAKSQTPTWDEMCFVKDLFWEESEWVVQFHPVKADYVNHHPGVLHLWKPVAASMPTPPKICV